MKKNMLSKTIVVLCLVMSLVGITQASAADKFKLKRLKLEGLKQNAGADVWVRTPSAIIVFTRDYSPSVPSYSLKSYKLESNGSTSFPVRFSEVPNGFILPAKAVWLEDQNKGYLFYSTGVANGALIFRFTEFDGNGSPPKSQATILLEMEPEGMDIIQNGGIAVAVGEDRIAVVMTTNYYRNSKAYTGFQKAIVHYAEVGFDGKIKTNPRVLKVENGGVRREARLHEAAWNGKKFLVPITFVRFVGAKVSGQIYGYSTSTVLYLRQIAVGGKSKKGQQLAISNVEKFGSTINDVCILPPYVEGASGKKSWWYVLYSKGTKAVKPETNLFHVNITHWTQRLNSKGKKKGGPRQVKTPQWNPGLIPTPGLTRINSDIFSNALALPDGRFLVAQTLGLREVDYSGGKEKDVFENELRLLAFDPKSGAVEVLSSTKPKLNLLFFEAPLLDRFGKDYAVLNGGFTLGQSVVQVIEFFSKFKSNIVQ